MLYAKHNQLSQNPLTGVTTELEAFILGLSVCLLPLCHLFDFVF